MFSYEDIQKYNETDMHIYKYILSNLDKIQYMTIRELAGETHVSSATLLRFFNKNKFEGYSDFKNALKTETNVLKTHTPMVDSQELSFFFCRVNSSAFEKKLEIAVELLNTADYVIFVGMGSSGSLARYGARYFSNLGKFSVSLEDTYYPVETFTCSFVAVIVLSESGETKEIIELVQKFRQKECLILSITNLPGSTLEKMSDWNFCCNMKSKRIHGGYNAATQVPVLFVMEALAQRL